LSSPWEHPPLHDCAACSRKRETALEAEVATLRAEVAELEEDRLSGVKREVALRAEMDALEAAGTRAQGAFSTNEFWADGMRVGKTLGFKNGVEASLRAVKGTDWTRNGVCDAIRALAQRGEGT
jgi:hypothetical protein